MKTRKYIEISEEIMVRLFEGKYVEGSLHRDENSGRIAFNPYNRKSRQPGYQPPMERLVHLTEYGVLTETAQRLKIRQSYPKKLGTSRIMTIIDRETKEVKNALITREIIELT